jgi:hypothetical protein
MIEMVRVDTLKTRSKITYDPTDRIHKKRADKMREKGVKAPLIVNWPNVIVSGALTYVIAKELGIEEIPVTFIGKPQ